MAGRRHQHTISGRVDVTALAHRGRRVTVRTYLPPDFETSGATYPVLYMFDGHNVFDVRTSTFNQEWGVDEAMERLHTEGRPTAVVVAIDAPGDRYERYAMYSIGEWDYRRTPGGRRLRHISGDGAATADFLLGDVRSYAERTYGVAGDRDRVGIAGSSMGGYMALYCAARHSERVSRVLAFSPVVLDHPMRGQVLREYLRERGAPLPQRIYLDMGDDEHLDYVASPGDLVDSLAALRDDLLAAGHRDVTTRVIPGGTHSERSWGARFPRVFRWAYAGDPLPE